MKILTDDWSRYNALSDLYSPFFLIADPRASRFDEGFFEELCEGTHSWYYREALWELADGIPPDLSELPTREQAIEIVRERSLKKVAESKREIPEDIRPLVADARVFALDVVSPEVKELMASRYEEYKALANGIYGRWLWHAMEEVPLLGDDAFDLLTCMDISSFKVMWNGGTLVLYNGSYRLEFSEARISPDPPESISTRKSEVYREGDVWEIHVTDDGYPSSSQYVITASGFEITRVQHRRG